MAETEVREMINNQNNEKNADEKETDDLIAKIEEAIKGENENEIGIASMTTTDMSKSSDTDFIKKLEEIENEELKQTNEHSPKTEVLNLKKNNEEIMKPGISQKSTSLNNDSKICKIESGNNNDSEKESSSHVNIKEKKNLNNEKNGSPSLLTQKASETTKKEIPNKPKEQFIEVMKKDLEKKEVKNGTLESNEILNKKEFQNVKDSISIENELLKLKEKLEKSVPETNAKSSSSISQMVKAINDADKMSVDENSDDKMDVDSTDNASKMEIDESKSPSDTKIVDAEMDELKIEDSPISESVSKKNKFSEVIAENAEKNDMSNKKSAVSVKPLVSPSSTVQNKNIKEVKDLNTATSLNATPVTPPKALDSTPTRKELETSSSKILESPESNQVKSASDTSSLAETISISSDLSDQINKPKEIVKNGLADTTTNEDLNIKENKAKLSSESNSETQIVEKSEKTFCYELKYSTNKNELDLLSIVKVNDANMSQSSLESIPDIGSDLSTSDEVTSLTQFALPQSRISDISSSVSSVLNSPDHKNLVAHEKITKKHFKNVTELMLFLNEHFTLNTNLNTIDNSVKSKTINTENTKKSRKRSSVNTPNNSIIIEEDIKPKGKVIKESNQTPEQTEEDDGKEIVFAQWSDKKYYAGKIIDKLDGNKYKILFGDGATKVIAHGLIIFGENGVIPLKDQPVLALIDNEYEQGKVISITAMKSNSVCEVEVDNKIYKLKLSDLCLNAQQAKKVQKLQTNKEDSLPNITPGRATRKRPAPSSPEAGSSGINSSGKKKRLPPPVLQRNYSESSDISDGHEAPAYQHHVAETDSSESILEPEGVQPELQRTEKESEECKMMSIDDYKSAKNPSFDKNSLDDLLGPFPKKKNLFKSKYFLLTCSTGLKPHRYDNNSTNNRNREFSRTPFIKAFLRKQIEAGEGVVYAKFDELPKSKYKQTKLIASKPCLTSKYIQCLAADIQAISHEWIIDCCRENKLLDYTQYHLASGWSITRNRFINWSIGNSIDMRESKQPLSRKTIFIASNNTDFIQFWSQICKLSGAKVRIVKSLSDVVKSNAIMVIESDLSQNIRNKATSFGITMVSPVFLHECLIVGSYCDPQQSSQFTINYQDDY